MNFKAAALIYHAASRVLSAAVGAESLSALGKVFADRRQELELERRRRRFWQGAAAVLLVALLLALFFLLPAPAAYCAYSSLPWLRCHG